ncbi:hypothetical protein HHI31_02605 [Campylobacter fetus subsp. venerealis]|uniref:hypothetical protein n=1 Tax=Campylobacter fetus TaxID=196 RepID=UPI0018E7D39B|nr:hypothetical protein [Campylobacter fetus]QQF51775.1 hypothetical protein HHI31_02605 [Campylobacter fetus subsp. venerealis]
MIESKFEKSLDNNILQVINLSNLLLKEQNIIDKNYTLQNISSAKSILLSHKTELIEKLDKNSTIRNDIIYDKNMSYIVKSSSVIYSIILLLCIFSLQKTARKNSIVPS